MKALYQDPVMAGFRATVGVPLESRPVFPSSASSASAPAWVVPAAIGLGILAWRLA